MTTLLSLRLMAIQDYFQKLPLGRIEDIRSNLIVSISNQFVNMFLVTQDFVVVVLASFYGLDNL